MVGNIKLLGEISDYYERKIFAAKYFMPSRSHLGELEKTQNDFFSLVNIDDYIKEFNNITDKTYDIDGDYKNILNHTPVLQLLNNNLVDLEKFYTLISHHEIEVARYNFWILYCKKAAQELIAELRKEYNLEN